MAMRRKVLGGAVAAALTSIGASQAALAQFDPVVVAPPSDIVELVTVGRMRSAADDVSLERQESAIVADFVDAESIGRIGDNNVAAALRRVPGVTLVNDQFVFVRGLGERYSNSLMNGAQIPSPDLTRNVIPLDIFPTSILKSVAVQKGYSADMPAAFSGGLIDIRTVSIPSNPLFSAELGSGFNSESTGDAWTYSGGGTDDLGKDDGTRDESFALNAAVNNYNGSLDPISIYQIERVDNPGITLTDAEQINRALAVGLNRNIDLEQKSHSPDLNGQVNVGNTWFMDNGMDLGFIAGVAYRNNWRSRQSAERTFGNPEEEFAEIDESIHSVNVTTNAALGWKWYDDHSVQFTGIFLRNTDDRAGTREYYTSSSNYSEGTGNLDYDVRYEQRELEVLQTEGSHRFGGITREVLGIEDWRGLDWADELTVDWFYSKSFADTDIPNQSKVTYQTTVDVDAGVILGQTLAPGEGSADFRFTSLSDEVENYGWNAKLPVYLSRSDLTLSGGYNYATKARIYKQRQYQLGTLDAAVTSALTGLPSQIFSDATINDPANDMLVRIVGDNGESYLASVINTAMYGQVDWKWDETWRIVAGVRWEDYSQVGLPWNPIKFDGCPFTTGCEVEDLLQSVFKDDDFYPSLAATWFRDDFFAEQFQLRFGYSETLVRPDLREITPASYIDPITSAIVSGNSSVVPGTVKNFDIRGDWYWDTGDTFSASIFYKDITDPIDFFESAAFEEALATEIINAESADLLGLEFEWMKNLGFAGNWAENFFVSGNLTLLDSELVAGPDADAPTNPARPLAGASDTSLNVQLGYDSWDGVHSAMLIYNVFSERLFFAGRNGTPDAYEQPFHSLDFTYFWYPTERMTFKVKAQNLLNEELVIEQEGRETFTQARGSSLSLTLRYAL